MLILFYLAPYQSNQAMHYSINSTTIFYENQFL